MNNYPYMGSGILAGVPTLPNGMPTSWAGASQYMSGAQQALAPPTPATPAYTNSAPSMETFLAGLPQMQAQAATHAGAPGSTLSPSAKLNELYGGAPINYGAPSLTDAIAQPRAPHFRGLTPEQAPAAPAQAATGADTQALLSQLLQGGA